MRFFRFFLASIGLLLSSCSEPSDDKEQVIAGHFDQILAEVEARPIRDSRFYKVTIKNYGSDPFNVYGLVRQQWSTDSNMSEWQEQPNGHSHAFVELKPGETFDTIADPYANADVLLRFGFGVRSEDTDDERWLLVWSSPRNPEMDWPQRIEGR